MVILAVVALDTGVNFRQARGVYVIDVCDEGVFDPCPEQHLVANLTGLGAHEPTCYDPTVNVSIQVSDDHRGHVRCYSPSTTYAYSVCPDNGEAVRKTPSPSTL